MPQDEDTLVTKPVRRRSPREPGFWERHKSDVVKTAISAIATILLGGAGYLLFGLNREVGQLQKGAEDTTRQLTEIRGSTIRAEDRLEGELRRLRERLDDLRDRLLPSRRSGR